MDLVLTANSPGEVAAWLTPVVRALRSRAPQAVISVFLPPCAFASGAEARVVEALPEVDAAYGPRTYLRYMMTRIRPPGFHPGKRGVVAFLGGDLYHAVLLARRLRYPAVAYTEGFARWKGNFLEFLVPHDGARQKVLRRGIPDNQVRVVGDLMLDAVKPSLPVEAARETFGLTGRGSVLVLFPGSRPNQVRHVLPFFLRVAELARADLPDLQCLVGMSPFTSSDQFVAAVTQPESALEGVGGVAASADHGLQIQTEKGLQATAVSGRQYDLMQVADVVLTLPGSNTAELAALGVPMVVAVPLNVLEEVPITGLGQAVAGIPGIGPRLKRIAVRRYARKFPLAALPNARAGREIVPEVRGVLRPEDVALPVLKLLKEERERRIIKQDLAATMGEPGAAGRVADRILLAAQGEDEPRGSAQ